MMATPNEVRKIVREELRIFFREIAEAEEEIIRERREKIPDKGRTKQ